MVQRPDDPFEQVPSSPPVSTDPPMVSPVAGATPSGPRRGRMAAVSVATSVLIGAGIVGVTQLASADDSDEPSLAAVTDDEATDDETSDDEMTDGGDGADAPDLPSIDGEVVIDTGDGEPIVIDLGELDETSFEEFAECAGLPDIAAELEGRVGDISGDLAVGDLPFDIDQERLDEFLDGLDGELEEWLGELDELEVPEFDGEIMMGPEGNHITVFGPDGGSVIELGDGDATVTITQNDGSIDIAADGDATVRDLDEIFAGLPFDLEELEGEIDLDRLLDDLPFDDLPFDQLPDLGELPELGDFPEIELPDPDVIRDCLEQLG